MNAIVIYKSNTGFTKKYAEWIAEALSCKAMSAENAKSIDLSQFDAVIFGGWFFAGTIQGFADYKEKLLVFNGKKAVFAVGAMPVNAPEAEKALLACFTEDERKTMGTFYMQGGLDYTQMNFVHKIMMKMMCAMMKKQHGADSAEYKTVSESFDATSKTATLPLVAYLREG